MLRTIASKHKDEQKNKHAQLKLGNAKSLYEICDIIARYYSSFLDYDIFQEIVDKFNLGKHVELEYSKHLEAYIKKHHISEFVAINPSLKKTANTSKELVLILDTEAMSKHGKVTDVKYSIARILDQNSSTIRFMDIDEASQQLSDASVRST